MKRREVLKGLSALGILALLPNIELLGNRTNTNLHFVALGNGGTNAMAFIHTKGIEANYTCITGSNVSHLTPDVNHVFWETPPEYRTLGIYNRKPLSLTREMKAIFSGDETFVILAGLGTSVGTGLIIDTLEFIQFKQKNYLAICSLPFKFEGPSKNEYANQKKAELERLKNVLFFDQKQLPTHSPDVPTEEWAKYKYAKLAKLTEIETEPIDDDACFHDHNGRIPDPGLLSFRQRFELGYEVFYSIFKQHFPQA